MIKRKKCIEYYFDSKKYNQIEVLQIMEQEKLEFPNEKVEVNIFLNDHVIYIAELIFPKNEISVIPDKMLKKIRKNKNTYKGYQTYNGDSKVYGKYKVTKNYSPI